MGAAKSKSGRAVAEQAVKKEAVEVSDASFADAINRVGTIRSFSSREVGVNPPPPSAVSMAQIKPLPKRRTAAPPEALGYVTMGEWFDAISTGKLPEGLSEEQAQLLMRYHVRLYKKD